ncbi:MAG: site-specific DNA-methyltransferase [Treponematales bacterium]
MSDYRTRSYLSTTEAAAYLGVKVRELQALVRSGSLPATQGGGGQYRLDIADVQTITGSRAAAKALRPSRGSARSLVIRQNKTTQKAILGNAQDMRALEDNSVHLAVTSPPYFNAKMYSSGALAHDLGNMHNMENWLVEIGKVWREVNSFRTLNLVGKSVDLCESAGFIFKRDIIWHKTNGVRAHFGTYPYPGGILLNNMHESILEFQKPDDKKFSKYGHLTDDIKERSKLDKDFWLSLKNTDVWVMNPEKSGDGRKHIAPFPLELPRRFIKAYTFIGETVLDPFCGSGTTLLTAANLERNGIGYEINPDFIPTVQERFTESKNSLFGSAE